MAAKSERGDLEHPFSTEGKPYFFDQGTADQLGTCYSCHPGGGPAEGIVQADGTVTPYDDPSLSPVHTYDRDFYSYSPNATTQALISDQSIEDTVVALGEPQRHDWNKSGVMEADCLLCHIDPESPYTYTAADGLKVQPFRPRLLLFAERQNGQVTRVSLGMPLKEGLLNESPLSYTNDLQRMSRPTPMLVLSQLPPQNVGEMMQMWTDGLKQIEASGVSLPYALYGSNVAKIWDASGFIKAAYTPNPNGPADEMNRLMGANDAINNLFAGFLSYMKAKGFLPSNATMDQMMGMFFNDFIYGYQIKDPMSGQLLPIPVALRAYEPGKIYTDWDNPNASVRDYVRAPFVEGEGIPYSGNVGFAWGAYMYAAGLMMQGDMTYVDPATGRVDLARVLADYQAGKISRDAIQPALHNYLQPFFYMMPTAQLMGLDFNGDGMPLTYVQLVKNGSEWQAKAYYNVSDLGDGAIHMDMFGGHEDINSYKWVRICGQCHVMTKDHGNSEWNRARLYQLGMPADWVKNGHYVNFTDDEEASGYDVHMSSKKMGCGSCHLREGGSIEDMHNFLKGTDTAHMVRNDLDNNPKPRTCESCHLAGNDPEAPNPTHEHEEKFGEVAGTHIANIACETCHAPFRRTWRFRAFDDTLGYFGNFDNRFGYNVLPGGDGKAMAYRPSYAISPVYGTSPGYGIPHFNMLAQHIDADGNGIVPMDFVIELVEYFNMSGSADPGPIVNGMPTNEKFDFWKYFYQLNLNMAASMGVPITFDPAHDNEVYPPLYWANSRNGYPQVVIGNPITILTWVDANPQPDHNVSALADSPLAYGGAKVLYLREINAAIKAFMPTVSMGQVDPMTLANIPPNDPTWAQNPNVGKVILKDSNYVIFDHTGDGFPELWWDEDVKAMQAALIKVLKAEGVENPLPILFMAAHYFSDTHGIQPAEKALGAESCYDCHGDYTKDPGAHRITDRVIGFLPWAPPWFREENRIMTFDPEAAKDAPAEYMRKTGMVPVNLNGLYVVDGEVIYIEPIQANGLSFLGAKAEDILEHSKHHAEELFYMTTEGSVRGDEIEEVSNLGLLTPEELETVYVRQVVNGPWNDKQYFYVPEHLRPEVTEMGIVPSEEFVYLDGQGFAQAYVVRIGVEEETSEPMIIRIPFSGANPEIWRMDQGDFAFRKDSGAVILGFSGPYVIVKVNGPAEYVAVEKGTAEVGPVFQETWGAFAD